MKQKRSEGVRNLMFVLIGQSGFITLGVIAVSVLLGLWLDGIFHTGRTITVILILAGIPISILLMLGLSRRTLMKMQADAQKKDGTKS